MQDAVSRQLVTPVYKSIRCDGVLCGDSPVAKCLGTIGCAVVAVFEFSAGQPCL